MRANQVYINTEQMCHYATVTNQTILPGTGSLNNKVENVSKLR